MSLIKLSFLSNTWGEIGKPYKYKIKVGWNEQLNIMQVILATRSQPEQKHTKVPPISVKNHKFKGIPKVYFGDTPWLAFLLQQAKGDV